MHYIFVNNRITKHWNCKCFGAGDISFEFIQHQVQEGFCPQQKLGGYTTLTNPDVLYESDFQKQTPEAAISIMEQHIINFSHACREQKGLHITRVADHAAGTDNRPRPGAASSCLENFRTANALKAQGVDLWLLNNYRGIMLLASTSTRGIGIPSASLKA